jgi:hypothetical protein
MLGQIAVRFMVGGAVVSVVSLVGEVLEPKTLSGLFGAAPSVALATLALAYADEGAGYVQTEARSMVIGAGAMCLYSVACVLGAKRPHVPIWLSAGLAWLVWIATALGAWRIGQALRLVP